MSDYIRRENLIDAFGLSEKTRKYGGDHSGYDTRMLYEIQDTIESLEPADVVQMRHGKWTHKPDIHGVVYCSECDYGLHINATRFCPNCGAKMDGGDEHG